MVLPRDFTNKDKSSENETVFLDSLDGFAFEALCQRIFEKSGWGHVERIGMTGDAGRDLIIHSTNKGKIIVECKHQPKTSIGRPIVQKLHSAIISSNSNQGIIITTGKFSQQAINYAKELNDGTNIQLFDMQKLTELAQNGGIRIISKNEDLRVYTFPISEEAKLKTSLLSKFQKFQCHPKNISDEMKISIDSISLLATYEAIVDIVQDFTTSAGLIHEIRKISQKYYFDGDQGYPLNTHVYGYLPTVNATVLFDRTKIDDSIKISPFSLESTTLSNRIIDSIIRDETTTVRYRGKNNVTYTKTCVPNKKNIRINDINQILIPNYKIELQIFGKKYFSTIVENKNRLNFKTNEIFKCQICQQMMLEDKILICNACGNLCHSTEIKPKHSFSCEECEKTICKNCTYYTRKFLFLKKKLCYECVKTRTNNPKKLN